MATVFVLGAGSSCGESLETLPGPGAFIRNNTPPPVLTGFFKRELLNAFGYSGETAEKDFAPAFEYIRYIKQLKAAVGEGDWNTLDLEEVFTSLELTKEFSHPDSDPGAALVLTRNSLVRYIWRIIGFCTLGKYGMYSKRIVEALNAEDTLITFNWDLLLDQELQTPAMRASNQYINFLTLALKRETPMFGPPLSTGLFLKMHGSLNWFRCTNVKCSGRTDLELDYDVQKCLNLAVGIRREDTVCTLCGSELVPLIVPPLAHKPIAEDWLIRATWGLARQRLVHASRVVIIGFSVAPTDFYAQWLLRTSVGLRNNIEIFVVNPDNDPRATGHEDFCRRMHSIFPRGYNDEFRTFAEIDNILARIR